MSSVRQRKGARVAPVSPLATSIAEAETPDVAEAVEASPIHATSEVPKRVSTQSRFGWLVDFLLVVVLLASGLYLRLTSIDNPNKIVFDEVHFTQFATWYLSVSVHGTLRTPEEVDFIAFHPELAGKLLRCVDHAVAPPPSLYAAACPPTRHPLPPCHSLRQLTSTPRS